MNTHSNPGYPGARTELLSRGEVAQILGVSRNTVLRMVDRGELPAIRVGERLIRCRRSDIEAWLASREPVNAAAARAAAEGR